MNTTTGKTDEVGLIADDQLPEDLRPDDDAGADSLKVETKPADPLPEG